MDTLDVLCLAPHSLLKKDRTLEVGNAPSKTYSVMLSWT